MNGKYNISPDFDIVINLMESQLSKTTTQGEQLKQFQTINEIGRMLLEKNTTALEFPFPTGVEDCYSALKWAYANTNNLRIDANRIAAVGDSAGGALAAVVTQMAHDRKETPVCFQMLCYPVTDIRQITKSVEMFIDTPIWNSPRNAMMWKVYLRNADNEICITNASKII